jgi:uncharacterized membrane protein
MADSLRDARIRSTAKRSPQVGVLRLTGGLALIGRLSLGLMLCGGLALRLFRLGAANLWYDETVSVVLAGSPLPELIRHTAGDIHPPGYYMLLRGWLLLMGYPTGHADPAGSGLEFAAGFFSLACGVLLIALIYVLARRATRGFAHSRRTALVAAALAACSPYHVWYSQEVRMYTLGAALGVLALYALLRALAPPTRRRAAWWAVYALAAAAGMYTLYYFAFLLIALNLWVLVTQSAPPSLRGKGEATSAWPGLGSALLANLAAAALYIPWIPTAWRQATQPPVPPWRSVPDLLSALRESWAALVLGQSASAWMWPVLLIAAGCYLAGLVALRQTGTRRRSAAPHPAQALGLATFGSLALILLVSLATPLYHVRYLFTYSPAFYVVLAAGLVRLWTWRPHVSARLGLATAAVCATLLLAATGISLRDFWTSPAFHTDDLRGAVEFLQAHWRPDDVLIVNAGYTYTALQTYWNGPIASRTRLTGDLPAPRADGALVMVTTGHVDGAPGLGWDDPRSDFFAMPTGTARQQIGALFSRFTRVWQYRIYDTVNDPAGLTRAELAQNGTLFEDQPFAGEANMRVQGFLSLGRAQTPEAAAAGGASFEGGLSLAAAEVKGTVAAGQTLYVPLRWQIARAPGTDFATSVRLVRPDGDVWAQPADDHPAGAGFPAHVWPAHTPVPQTLALPVPLGTPPGAYTVTLVVYDPATGSPWPPADLTGTLTAGPGGVVTLGRIDVIRPAAWSHRPALATFGPLALVDAGSPATTVAPGGSIPLDLTWQAVSAPGEPLVVVAQLLDGQGSVAAGLEAQPLDARYPTQNWAPDEIVRDRHTLAVPPTLAPGRYQLIVGLYRASDRARLPAQTGLFTRSPYYVIKTIEIEP